MKLISYRSGRDSLFIVAVLLFLLFPLMRLTAQDGARHYRLHSAMPAYWNFLDENKNSPASVRAKNFRKGVINSCLEAYNAVAYPWLKDDESLVDFIGAMDGKTQKFHRVDSLFSLRMENAWNKFAAYAPDLKPGVPVFLLPAPRIAIGGSVRPLKNGDAVILGSEELSGVIESQTAFNVLVNHEMTHLYHLQVNPEMRKMVAAVYMPPYDPGAAKIYQVLWLEGLAAYTSKVLNPSATDEQVLLSGTIAGEVKALWPGIGADIRKHLDSNKKDDIDKYLFDGQVSAAFPRRTGYYVGMLIAAKLSKKYSFAQLCRLQGKQLQNEVEATLRSLEASNL